MGKLEIKRTSRAGLIGLAILTAGVLVACGPGQGSSSTKVVLTGPPDKVETLIAQHKLRAPQVQTQVETLPDGRERATFQTGKALPMGAIIALGKDAADRGVAFEFSSGSHWSAGSPPAEDQQTGAQRPAKPIV